MPLASPASVSIPQLTRRARSYRLKGARYLEGVRSVGAAGQQLASPGTPPKAPLIGPSASGEGQTLRPHQLIPQDARYTEAVRSVVAAALQLATPQRPPKTFLVTSSVPREGKTTLAISFRGFRCANSTPRSIDRSLFQTTIDRERAWSTRR